MNKLIIAVLASVASWHAALAANSNDNVELTATENARAMPPRSLTPASSAQQELGDHPAVIVARRSSRPDYDYASQFYPHPAYVEWARKAPRLEQ